MTSSAAEMLRSCLLDSPLAAGHLDDPGWEALKQLVKRYGLATILAESIRSELSGDRRAWCDDVLIRSWKRHDRMLDHLNYVNGVLEDHHIRSIALKGPALAVRYYRPPFLRKPAMDLDLAVREEDLDSACSALAKAGYVPDSSAREARARSHHIVLQHSTRCPIELHFRLSHMNRGIPCSYFMDRSVACPTGAGQVQVLAPADQLLHLILHLAQSRYGSMFHLYEIGHVRQAESEGVLEQAVKSAIDWHFCGAIQMTDIAFRTRIGRPLLPPGLAVPRTWLQKRLTRDLYLHFEEWAEPGRQLTLAWRLLGRWLDFQTTDRPQDALGSLALMAQLIRFNFARRQSWSTAKTLRYAPDDNRSATSRSEN